MSSPRKTLFPASVDCRHGSPFSMPFMERGTQPSRREFAQQHALSRSVSASLQKDVEESNVQLPQKFLRNVRRPRDSR